MANYSLYTGSSVVDYFHGEESTTGLPIATIASAHADTSAVTWGSVGGVVGFLMLALTILVALRRKLAAVDHFFATLQSGFRAALNVLRPHHAHDPSTSPMATPSAGGVPFRNATNSERRNAIEMRGLGHCASNSACLEYV